jgi:hypothetical protein
MLGCPRSAAASRPTPGALQWVSGKREPSRPARRPIIGGGLVATAPLGTVLAAHGPALLAAFHTAMIAGAAACAVAAFSAFSLLAVINHQPNARR